MARNKALWLSKWIIIALGVAMLPAIFSYAQGTARTFLETGKTVKGRFLQYWDANGGLPQQGFPISEEMQERSDTDGKTYTVQYFERAVFELHPEKQPPHDVLLSLLGSFLYKQKYPNGAPNQQPNTSTGSIVFSETGKRLGGKFLEYWNTHGSLAQQGFPISEEFMEKSETNGKTYRVQYFERAVFEHHPENAGNQYEVLLSQLGTFRYKAKYAAGGSPSPTAVPARAGWSQIVATNTGPKARYDHTALIDPVRKQLVVFGGRGDGTFGDTWVLDLSTRMWREVKGPGPSPRFGHGTVYDATNRRMIVVMGEGAGFFNDVWAFDLDRETWKQLKANANAADAPRTRYGQSAALDGKGRVFISHGFSDQGRFDDTWAFDLAANKWINLTPASGPKPLKRCLHELVYDASADRMILFGGCSSGYGPCPQGDMWAFDLKSNTWKELAPSGARPSPRSNPSLAYDATGKKLFLFGGKTSGGANAEAWSYNLASNTWTKLEGAPNPSARSSQSTSGDTDAGRVIIFGGQTPNGLSTDIWEWRY
jgi:hypothetical protein